MKKWFWLLLMVVGLGTSASAQTYQKIQGFCETGNQAVTTDGRQSTTKVQRSYPSCSIQVYNGGTVVNASIATNSSGTPKSNPFTADSDGYWYFYALAGTYDVRMSGGGLASPITRSGYWIVDGGGGGSGITGSGTTNRFPIFTSSTVIGNSVFQQTGVTEFGPISTGKRINLGSGSQQVVEIANASVGGTTQNRIAKLTGAPSTAVTATTSDTTKLVGIVAAGAGTTGNAQIVTNGNIACDFDGAATAGNYVGASTTLAGRCSDLGATLPTSGVQVLGRVLETIGSAGSASVYVFTGEQGRGGAAGSGTANYLSYWTDANTLGATNALFSIADQQFQFGYSIDIANGGLSELTLETDQIIFKGGVSRANNAIMQTMKATASQTGAFQRFTSSAGSVRYEVDIDGDSKPRGVNYSWPSTLPVSTGCLQVTTGGVISVVSCVSGTGVRYAFNVKQAPYNCTGDGATDDTTCFQTALDDAAAAGGYVVYAPAATYKVTGLTIEGGVTLEGDGPLKTIIYSTSNAVILDAVEGTGSYTFYGPSIRDIQIKGSIVAGSSQIGLKMDDGTYYLGAAVRNVNIYDTGSNGIYIGNVYSSRWENMFISNTVDYPFLYNSANMPGNSFVNIYIGDLRASAPTGFRIKKGDFICTGCNGINNEVASSRWAAVGTKTGVDGDLSNTGATFDCLSCNIEAWVGYGIYSYASSLLNLRGATTFSMSALGVATGIPVYYENNGAGVDYFSQYIRRGVIEDSVLFANTVTDYANSQPIQSVGFPAIETAGFGPSVSSGTLSTFRNTTTSANVPLSRKDGQSGITTVTTSTTFAQPGLRYIEANCGAACTITLPWAGFYRIGQAIVIKDISGAAATNNITVAAGSGSTVNGAVNFTIAKNGQSITVFPNNSTDDWRIINSDTPSAGITGSLTNGRVTLSTGTTTVSDDSDLTFDGTNLSSGRYYFTTGTNGAPSVSPNADNNTGFYSVADGKIGYSSNGTESLRLQSNGLLLRETRITWDSSETIYDLTGSGTPEGSVTASVGSVYRRTNGAAGTTLYVKESGSGNTGWTAVSNSPSLTATYVGYGNGSNVLTGTSDLTYNTSTRVLTVGGAAGTPYVHVSGVSDAAGYKVNAGAHPGNGGGLILPFVGGGMSTGPGVWWCANAYASCSGLYINNGLTYQGASSTHDKFKLAESTGTSSNGTVRYMWEPSSSLLTQTLSTGVTASAHVMEDTTVTSTGTAAAGFGTRENTNIENASGSNVLAVAIDKTWSVATASAETGKYEIVVRNQGSTAARSFTVEGRQNYGTVNSMGNQSGSFTVDFSLGNYVTMTATSSFTTLTFSNIKAGAKYVLQITNNGTGNAQWTPPTTFKYPGGISGNVLTQSANAVDVFVCETFDTTNLWCNGLFDVKNP